MQISSRFSLAAHTVLCISVFQGDYKVTSDFIAGSTGVNSVIICKIMVQLKKTGLIDVPAGTGGARLIKSLKEITLLVLYRAIEPVEEDKLFDSHKFPNPQCPVGRNIYTALSGHMQEVHKAMEQYLQSTTPEGMAEFIKNS